jgi:perosamine synthetase
LISKPKVFNYIPLSIPDIRGNASEAVGNVIRDNWVSSSSSGVDIFEEQIAKIASSRFALATINGSAALHLALVTLGIGKGSKVIVPDLTFAATVNAVILAGATPIFVDVNNYSWTLDINLTKEAIKLYKPDAIIVVHTLGHPAEMDELKIICSKNKMLLIEDAAGAIGSKYKGRIVGSIGDAGVYSFNGNKVLTTGGGGALLLQSEKYEKKSKVLYRQARIANEYSYHHIGFNYRMPNINAALGLSQLEYLPDLIKAKKHIANVYDDVLMELKNITSMPRLDWGESSCWLYSIKTANKEISLSLISFLKKRNIEAKLFWNALSIQRPYKKFYNLLQGNSINFSGTIVSIPCSSSLKKEDQLRVIEALIEWDSNAKF